MGWDGIGLDIPPFFPDLHFWVILKSRSLSWVFTFSGIVILGVILMKSRSLVCCFGGIFVLGDCEIHGYLF